MLYRMKNKSKLSTTTTIKTPHKLFSEGERCLQPGFPRSNVMPSVLHILIQQARPPWDPFLCPCWGRAGGRMADNWCSPPGKDPADILGGAILPWVGLPLHSHQMFSIIGPNSDKTGSFPTSGTDSQIPIYILAFMGGTTRDH